MRFRKKNKIAKQCKLYKPKYKRRRIGYIDRAQELKLLGINSNNDIIEKICNKLKIECFRGPEENLLTRYKMACDQIKPKIIVLGAGPVGLVTAWQLLAPSVEYWQRPHQNLTPGHTSSQREVQ